MIYESQNTPEAQHSAQLHNPPPAMWQVSVQEINKEKDLLAKVFMQYLAENPDANANQEVLCLWLNITNLFNRQIKQMGCK